MSTVLSSANTVIDTRHVMYGEIHMLVTNKEVLNIPTAEDYAVGAFNINNMEILQVIVEATTEEKSPIIVSVSPSAIKYAGLDYVTAMVKAKMRLFGSSGKAP